MKAFSLILAIVSVAMVTAQASAGPLVVTFDDLALSGSNSFYDGGPSTNADGWTTQGTFFGNSFKDWGGGFTSWEGFAYSNVNDTTTPGYTNQYAAYTGTAFSGTIYAVAYTGSQAFVNMPTGYRPGSVRLTNTTYAALDMLSGSLFSPLPFTQGDYLSVTFTGYGGTSATGSPTGSTTFYLANFLNGNSTIVNTWDLLDLTPLGDAVSIGLSWASSNDGTPSYVALDNLTLMAVPEPGAATLAAVGAAWCLLRRRRRRAGRVTG